MNRLQITMALALAGSPLAISGCRCGPTAPQPDESASAVTVDAATEPETTPVVDADGPSAEVRALLEGGDPAAIAADMASRAARLRGLVASTEESSRALETTAESMTGRQIPLDPKDPVVVDALVSSAQILIEGADTLGEDVVAVRQLIVDLQAEADALYGRPGVEVPDQP